MKNYMLRYRCGFTLAELAITLAIVPIVILSAGLVWVDGQKGWNKTYHHVNDSLITDGYVATGAFESVVRKASTSSELLSGDQLYVYYYNDPDTSGDEHSKESQLSIEF